MENTMVGTNGGLLETVGAALVLSGPQREAVAAIADYSFADVRERLVKEQVIPADQVDEAILEFRKFLLCILLGQGSVGMISKTVDEVWHAFILFTMDYTQFTKQVFGRYVHHAPVTSRDQGSPDAVPNFLSVYRSLFGAVPAIWGPRCECGSCCDNAPNCNPTEIRMAECSGTTNCQEKDCYGAACEEPTAFKDTVQSLDCVGEGACVAPVQVPAQNASCVLPPGNCENVCDSD